jgi:hypothetical protein
MFTRALVTALLPFAAFFFGGCASTTERPLWADVPTAGAIGDYGLTPGPRGLDTSHDFVETPRDRASDLHVEKVRVVAPGAPLRARTSDCALCRGAADVK